MIIEIAPYYDERGAVDGRRGWTWRIIDPSRLVEEQPPAGQPATLKPRLVAETISYKSHQRVLGWREAFDEAEDAFARIAYEQTRIYAPTRSAPAASEQKPLDLSAAVE